jgi:hypothetical protein
MPTQLRASLCALFAIFLSSFAVCDLARASSSLDEYIAALRIADQYVQRQKALASSANALSASALRRLMGRYYRVGETWDVAVFRPNTSMMRMTDDPEQLRSRGGMAGIFRYKVSELKVGERPEIVIEITQLEDFGIKPIDSEVDHIALKVDDRLAQIGKTYFFRSSSIISVPGRVRPLDLLPLDAPEVLTAERHEVTALPQLPVVLSQIASQAGVHFDRSRSSWLEQSDFFGRPVRFLWQQGDPWPSYLSTANGVAILIRKGGV